MAVTDIGIEQSQSYYECSQSRADSKTAWKNGPLHERGGGQETLLTSSGTRSSRALLRLLLLYLRLGAQISGRWSA
jgi:hypothetical protein